MMALRLLLSMMLTMAGCLMAAAQQRVVVADAVTHLPITHASLYTNDGGHFRSAMSNEQGVAVVAFPFQRLTVSHLNYERRVVRRLADTLFLTPKYRSTAEVVITNQEPEWIRRKLKQVVRLKEQYYFTTPDTLLYDYRTQSMGTNNIYRYHLTGLMCPRSIVAGNYAIMADTSDIVASDSTLLTDTNNLRRMLYEDFVAELDNAFIRSHKFFENTDFNGGNGNEVELRFRSKHSNDDRGWIILDTARCIVRQAYRFTGTKTNCRERISAFMYAAARLMGYRIDSWTRDYRVDYQERTDGTLYPAMVNYKMYYAGRDGGSDSQEQQFNEQTGGGFPNMEATLSISPCPGTMPGDTIWHELCPSWYIKYNTEADRQREIELSNLPATFTIYSSEQ